MAIIMYGTSYHKAPIAIRERCALNLLEIKGVLQQLLHISGIEEAVVLSTCNRTEFYLAIDLNLFNKRKAERYLQQLFKLSPAEINTFFSWYENVQAVEHLLKVTTGLDAMILGETQILGQVKVAYQLALDYSTTSKLLNRLFQRVLSFAKQAHQHTQINDHPISLSYAAVKHAERLLNKTASKTFLVLGAGKMGQLAVDYLSNSSQHQIILLNRDSDKAKQMAKPYQIKHGGLDQLSDYLKQVDVLISTVSTPKPLLGRSEIQAVVTKPLICYDLSVPRSIAHDVRSLEGIQLFDLDQLNQVIDAHSSLRKQAASQIEILIKRELKQFSVDQKIEQVAPSIAKLYDQIDRVKDDTVKRITVKLPHLTDQELQLIEKHMFSAMNQLVQPSIKQLKMQSVTEDSEIAKYYFELFFKLSQIDREGNYESFF
ncbi:glutamyl-tRNA reductase [Amphibacillus marinus]|uniref:Glutamyl-tRNA reductase n=1 Tax=Amphibacillus marinus TaxID=872970 RepID=A0A1H8SJY2_9BACI|nr:glutamyl-tRNA reductase [Amphibacillus marinus]SEO78674.1 glutamyl-tRNA reductase [Amphibacillus marinus]